MLFFYANFVKSVKQFCFLKYDWLSYGKLYKAVGYATPEENEKLVFEEHDGLKYDVVMLHIDCVELFAYYNHKIVAALAKCTKRSMEILKQRSNVSALVKIFSCEDDEKPLLKASIELKIPDFKLVPKMPEIQKFYEGTLMNIIETHYGISTWGKEAKTEERRKRKPLIDEIRHEKHFFKTISEHKEVMRYKLSFDNGVLQLESKINSILDDLRDEYSYLWSTDRDEQLETFVQSKPLIPDIRDRLKYLDGIIEDIAKLDPIICVRTIEVDRTKMINALIEEAKAWKSILGSKLSDFYKEILDDSVSFIQNQQKKLERNLADLDDCRITMTCLRTIRENYFRIDENLHILEETYATFAAFHLNISVEDSDRVDGLRYNFNNMINSADTVNLKLLKLQVPLLKQLEEGIEKFVEDLATFNENFVKVGPMIQGIAAKEATDRNILYDVILQELARRNETFSDGQLLFGLDVTEFPLIQKRKDEIAFLHQFFKLHGNVVRCIKNYSDTLVSEVNVNNMEMELQEFAEVHKAFEIPKDLENWANLEKLRAKIEKFIKLCPALILLTNSALKDDHWKVLEAEMSYGFAYNSGNFTLRIIIEAPLMDFEQIIGDIYVQALKDQENERKPKKFAMEEVQENVLK